MHYPPLPMPLEFRNGPPSCSDFSFFVKPFGITGRVRKYTCPIWLILHKKELLQNTGPLNVLLENCFFRSAVVFYYAKYLKLKPSAPAVLHSCSHGNVNIKWVTTAPTVLQSCSSAVDVRIYFKKIEVFSLASDECVYTQKIFRSNVFSSLQGQYSLSIPGASKIKMVLSVKGPGMFCLE